MYRQKSYVFVECSTSRPWLCVVGSGKAESTLSFSLVALTFRIQFRVPAVLMRKILRYRKA